MRAVISRSIGQCRLEDLETRPVGPRDVLVRIEASGICHSDVSVCDGSLGSELPAVLGHEGVGRVLEIGRDVTSVSAGDRVVLAAVAPCGLCWSCSRGEPYLCAEIRRSVAPAFLDHGRPVRGTSGLGTLADAIVVEERATVRVDSDLPAAHLAVIGCAVLTGAGSVLNIAATRAGDRVLVIGAGGVGLAAVQAASAVGAELVAVVDPDPRARETAISCGADHAADPGDPDGEGVLFDLTAGRGFDSVIECVGRGPTFGLAWRLTRRGGHVVLVGVAPRSETLAIPLAEIPLSGRRISGCVYGSSSVHRDVPMYVAMAESGRLDLGRLVGRTIGLGEAPAVILGAGTGPGRTVVVA